MARFLTLASGSSGNCAFLGTARRGILIDAGISATAILRSLQEQQIPPEAVQAIFITHEHSDHIKGLNVLVKRLNVPVLGTPGTIRALCSQPLPASARLTELRGPVEVGELEVESFRLPHDSAECCGYRVTFPGGTRIGMATDMGYISPETARMLRGCELVCIESNYDLRMLEMGSYPYSLKLRVKGPNGHLSNGDCASFLPELIRSGTTRLVLGHLSKNNNHPQLARDTALRGLSSAGMTVGVDYILEVAPRDIPGRMMIL